ncbi:HAD-IA family hydrolase [Candidatus Dojkabacteria bacterium]|nr:HAD-IA family hydrolase [Candidatus Dojkabacteria bacterium]
MKRHIIFDLDDTISASYDFNQQMFVDTFLPYMKSMTEQNESYLRNLHFITRGKAMHLIFEEALKEFNITADPIKMVAENEELHKKNAADGIICFEGAEDFFKQLKANEKILSICTNRQYGSLKKILDNGKLSKYFDNIISCSDEGHEKPDPYCIEELVKKYDIPKTEYMYFGDSKTDFDFASNAGIDFLIIDQYLNKKQFYKAIVNLFANV